MTANCENGDTLLLHFWVVAAVAAKSLEEHSLLGASRPREIKPFLGGGPNWESPTTKRVSKKPEIYSD